MASLRYFSNVERYADPFLGTPILCAYVDGQVGDGHNMKEYEDPDGNTRYSFMAPTAERIVGAMGEVAVQHKDAGAALIKAEDSVSLKLCAQFLHQGLFAQLSRAYCGSYLRQSRSRLDRRKGR